MTLEADILALEAALPRIPERNQAFAASLIAQYRRYRSLSHKQAAWVVRLAQPESNTVWQPDKVIALLSRPTAMKYPKLRINSNRGRVALSLAGPRSSRPGLLNVKLESDWIGRFDSGRLVGPGFPTGLEIAGVDAPEWFARLFESPETVLAEAGKYGGHCVYCFLPLSDSRSTEKGYGPICARNWGLDW